MGEIEPNDIVNSALEMNSDAIHNAIISLMFTTGLDKRNIRNITINELLKAAAMCFKEDESHNIEILTNKNDDDMVLCWTFENDSKHQVIFSSPNTTRYIIKYLKHNGKYYDFDDFDELFRIKDPERNEYAQLKENYISSMFNNKKEALKDYKDIPYGLKFTPGSFQLHFKKVCNEHLDLDDSEKKELIDLFIGEAGDDNKFYKEFKKDKKSILKYYERLLPYLEVNYFDVNKHINVPSNKNGYSDSDIRNIVKNYFLEISTKNNHFPNYDNIFKWTEIAFVIAKRDNEQSIFKETEEYFDTLYKRTYLRVFFEDKDISINIILKTEFDYQDAAVEIGDILDECGFFEKFDVDISKFKSIFMDIIECSYCSKIDTYFVIDGIESAYYINDSLKLIEEDF